MRFDPYGRNYQYPTMIQLPDLWYGMNHGQLEAAREEHELVFGCIRRLLERAFTTGNEGEK